MLQHFSAFLKAFPPLSSSDRSCNVEIAVFETGWTHWANSDSLRILEISVLEEIERTMKHPSTVVPKILVVHKSLLSLLTASFSQNHPLSWSFLDSQQHPYAIRFGRTLGSPCPLIASPRAESIRLRARTLLRTMRVHPHK